MGLFLLLLPLAEVMLAINLGRHFGALPVLAALGLGIVVGTVLIRLRGQMFFRQAMAAINRHEMPGDALVGGIVWYVAGMLLILPGFISDVLALLVLLPPVRCSVLARFQRLAEVRLAVMQGGTPFQWTPRGSGPSGAARHDGGQVYEGEGREIDEAAPRLSSSEQKR